MNELEDTTFSKIMIRRCTYMIPNVPIDRLVILLFVAFSKIHVVTTHCTAAARDFKNV
jgi:hypothetical protein